MNFLRLAAAVSAALVPLAAAAAPTISGDYIVIEHRLCQSAGTYHLDDGSAHGIGDYVDGVGLSSANSKHIMLQAKFSSAKGKVTFAGFQDAGDTMLYQLSGITNTTLGIPLAEAPSSGTDTYSNTGTTITLGTDTYNIFYGQVDKKGVAHVFAYQGMIVTNGGAPCSVQGQGTMQ